MRTRTNGINSKNLPQLLSSLRSGQSTVRSHRLSPLIHWPLPQRNWSVRHSKYRRSGEKRVKRIINQNRVSTCIIEYTERSRNQNRNVLPTAWKRPLKSFKKKKKGKYFPNRKFEYFKNDENQNGTPSPLSVISFHHMRSFFWVWTTERREGRIMSRVDLNKLKALLLYTRY